MRLSISLTVLCVVALASHPTAAPPPNKWELYGDSLSYPSCTEPTRTYATRLAWPPTDYFQKTGVFLDRQDVAVSVPNPDEECVLSTVMLGPDVAIWRFKETATSGSGYEGFLVLYDQTPGLVANFPERHVVFRMVLHDFSLWPTSSRAALPIALAYYNLGTSCDSRYLADPDQFRDQAEDCLDGFPFGRRWRRRLAKRLPASLHPRVVTAQGDLVVALHSADGSTISKDLAVFTAGGYFFIERCGIAGYRYPGWEEDCEEYEATFAGLPSN